jgi:hypothetical protein
VTPADLPAPAVPAPAAKDTSQFTPLMSDRNLSLTESRSQRDPAVIRTSQQLPDLPTFLTTPQQAPRLSKPPLLAPNITSEAEQVARMLTGQPLPPNTTSSMPSGAGSDAMPTANVAALATSITAQPTGVQMPKILVNPSPVIVVSPPPTDAKKKQQPKSRLHKMMNSLGNRISQALPNR